LVRKYLFLILILILFSYESVFSIESALHEAELAKCIGILSTIKNNDFKREHKLIASNTLDNYSDKINRLHISSALKEMIDNGSKKIMLYLHDKKETQITDLLNNCILVFRVGN
tara:strand:- start:122 stop:463 length:342 start_codon:yes stop_codon:yes gene_type:complete